MGLSIRGYARLRGVSHTAVRRAIASGRIHPLPDGTIDPASADREWDSNTDATKPRSSVGREQTHPPAGEAPPSSAANKWQGVTPLAVSLAIKESYKARREKLEFEEKSKTLVKSDEVRVAVFNMARRARDILLTIPDRIAMLVAANADAAECHKIIAGEIRKVCEELHEDPLGRDSEAAEG